MAVLRVKAYAKVNLFLEITGKRANGYHTLSTVFQTISLADELTLRPADTLRLSCSDASLPTDERNLAYRAADQFRKLIGERRGVHIHLEKKVPMGAGLGGGSSDAGTLLKALGTWWKKHPSPSLLHRCARRLGADVPFFLQGGTCAAGGIGDRLQGLPALKKTWLVLVYPGFGVNTREAYARVKVPVREERPIQSLTRWLSGPQLELWSDRLFNRFEEFVFPGRPTLVQLKQALREGGAQAALMSGSGSSVFGVVENESIGRRVLDSIRKKYPQSWLVHTL